MYRFSVPGSEYSKMYELCMNGLYPDLREQYPDLLHKKTSIFPAAVLKVNILLNEHSLSFFLFGSLSIINNTNNK